MVERRLGTGAQRHLKRILVLVAILCLSFSGVAEAKTKSKTRKVRTKTHRTMPAAPPQNLYAGLVVEANSGRVLYAENADGIRHPASLTKMMTLYLAFQAIERGIIRIDTPLTVSQKAAAQSPSKLGLKAGQTIRAYDAIMGLITQSANDAAVVIAEALAGSTEQFAQLMIAQSRALGMRKTVFENPNGLPDPNQVTSAKDMATLGYALIYHYPGFYPYFNQNSFVYRGRSYNNHNNLMKRYEGMDGIKTGYIRASGFNLVASAARGETRLIGVVFGGSSAASRDKQMEKLLDKGFVEANRPAQSDDEYLPLPSKVSVAFTGRGQRAAQTAGMNEPQIIEGEDETTRSVGWGIQVGAFSDVSGAQRALASMARIMAPLLGGAEQNLQKITTADGSPMYRARFTGLDQKTAREACAYMVKHGQSCLVLSGP